MYGQTPFDTSKHTTNISPKGLTALLLSLIVCYQVLNNVFFSKEESQLSDYEGDGACAAAPGVPGASSLCMEAHLFSGWKAMPAESHEDTEQLLSISPNGGSQQQAPATQPTVSAPALEASASTGGSLRASTSDLMQAKPEALEGMLWDMAFKMGGGDQTHSAPEKTPKKPAPSMRGAAKAKPVATTHKQSFSESLTDLQQKLEAKLQAQARAHAEHRALRALHVAAHEPAEAAAADDGEKGMTEWAHHLDDMTHELQDHMKLRRKARAEHEADRFAAQFAAMTKADTVQKTAQSHEHKSAILDEVQEMGQRLCQDPERRNRPACAQFLQSGSSSPSEAASEDRRLRGPHKDLHAEAMVHIKLLEKHLDDLHKEHKHETEEIQHESTELLRNLCADPARSSYPICARVLATASAASPSTAASDSQGASTETRHHHAPGAKMHWIANAGEGSAKASHAGTPPLLLQRHDLRGAHWEGKVPKVACVTVLPHGGVTETLMKYFMDNYHLQHYEGEHQLVIVYHSADKAAARIAHLYANGTSVIAAAARGESEFPSATAYRYGAWLAHGADLVARWDFEAWHHPNRLSMQVRAMAVTERPASLVARITVFDEQGHNSTIPGNIGSHGSMIGDASWMQKHWMPLLETESSVALGLQSHSVVQVEMPELIAYHS